MAYKYVLFSLSLLLVIAATALFLTRSHWRHHVPDMHLPGAGYIYSQLPTSFGSDIEAGLSSSNFDLSANVEAGDSRAGLDDAGKTEVLKIMKKRRTTFDKARKIYMENRFKANGIGADGRPRDPKFVSFS
ncbi:protein precursor [Hirsutella rhossiliensis]|uniref:Protein n=1 Tax=Hirsutella rhossiliensis TaxID=111463 RepID=A0A9P8SG45_9HYPO|nr:protein precursor [Hirsutella rhossiliensis]KAH0960050.1 protein precursor [Hirsutella rhossiliensis]